MQNGSSVVSYSEKLRNTLRNNNVLMIGNGFDLALGKLSSYQDFLLYLFLVKLYLHVNGEKFQGPIDNLDALFEKCTNLDPKIKFIVDIVNRKIISIKKDINALILLCNFFYEKESFLELFSRVIFQSQNYDVNQLTEYVVGVDNDGNIGWSYSEFLFNKHTIHRISKLTQLTEMYSSNLKKCVEEFYNSLCPKKTDKSSIYINGWLDVESLIHFVVMPNELLEKRFLREPSARSSIEALIKRLDIALDVENSEKLYNSLQSFTDHFCDFLSLQEDTKAFDYESELVTIFENYEVLLCNQKVGLSNIVDFRNVISNFITSVVDFNYTLTSKHIFDDIYKFSGMRPSKFSIFHVNGSINNSGNNAIFGYTKTSKNPVNVNAFKFEKRSQRQLKDVNSPDFYALTENKYNLIIFGHSCSPADADVIRPLLLSPNLNVVVIFCYSQENKLSIYKNLDEILGAEKLDHLTRQTNDLENKLIWAVRKKH